MMNNCVDGHHEQSLYEEIQSAVKYIRSKVSQDELPLIGIVCGSGLGALADHLNQPTVIPYANIPGFPTTKVPGHKGNLVFGLLEGKRVVCMQGRIHPYEGHPMHKITMPIRVMHQLGVHTLMLTNAVGGLNHLFKAGNLMLVKDHICIPNLALKGPLVGENDDRLGPRFTSMANAYDRDLRKLASATALDVNVTLYQGIYIQVSGPQFETPAENRMLKSLGADAVGMSLAHETVVARHAGLKVIAVSLITNMSETDSDALGKADMHQEVLAAANQAATKVTKLFKAIIKKM